MASITIRNLDDTAKSRLRIQAAVNGRSMQDEARDILRAALNHDPMRRATWPRQFAPGSRHWTTSSCS